MTFLFCGTFRQLWHGKHIYHSLSSYDLLTTNYSSRVDMEVGCNNFTYLLILHSLLASNRAGILMNFVY